MSRLTTSTVAKYIHLVLKRAVELVDEPETIVAIDGGSNLAAAIAFSGDDPEKRLEGWFWRGSETKRTRGLYNHIGRRLQEERLLRKVNELRSREERKVNQQLHIIAKQIIEYAKQFSKPLIVMEG